MLKLVGMIATLAIAAVVFVIPRALGGTSLTVLTGSMEPTLRPGDVVALRAVHQVEVCGKIEIGQIITYLPKSDNPAMITHRVVGKTIGTFADGTSCRLITQGDANSAPDQPVSPIQVRGVFLYEIPKLGWARQWVVDHPKTVTVVGGLLLLAYLIWMSVRPPKTRVIACPRATEHTGAAAAELAADIAKC